MGKATVTPNVTVQAVTEFDHTTGTMNIGTVLSAPAPLFNRNPGNIGQTTLAYLVGGCALNDYSHECGPKKFTHHSSLLAWYS